ncbi:MAG TPA: hypothetical protein VJT31_02945 [Rugosimonospora sp.]|nr:hypothetical protein [Rugosimonospora sp.]
MADGERHIVECAVAEDGGSPAATFLDQLACGTWVEDPDFQPPPPDDDQIDDYDKILEWCRILADEGVPPYRTAVNYLGSGIWEFKLGRKRISFFDTPGDGTYSEKVRIDDRSLADTDDDYRWFPNLDERVRLGYVFPKLGEKAGQRNIDRCRQVREEDVNHDKR